MKYITKDNQFNTYSIIQQQAFEIIYGIFWNIIWGNIFYKCQFFQMNNGYLKVWTQSMFIFSFISASVYLIYLYLFLKYGKQKNENKFNLTKFFNQIWNCISIFANVILILISIDGYYFSQKFTQNGILSDMIHYYLIINAMVALFGSIYGLLCVLSYLLLRTLTSDNEDYKYQLIQEQFQDQPPIQIANMLYD